MMNQEHGLNNMIAKTSSLQSIQESIKNGVIIANTQAPLPFTTSELALNLVQKSLHTINQNS